MAQGDRGHYLTPNRALSLERRISAVEAGLRERIAILERDLERERTARQAQLHAIARALLVGLKEGDL